MECLVKSAFNAKELYILERLSNDSTIEFELLKVANLHNIW